MNFLNYFYNKNLKLDLINKFSYTDLKTLPKIKKITLNFGCKSTELKILTVNLLALELVTRQKGILTISKHPNLFLKIRKGQPTGCKLSLQKQLMLDFLAKKLNEVFPRIKNFNGLKLTRKIEKTDFSYSVKDILTFSELGEYYYLFNNLPSLDISIITNVKTHKELLFLLKSLQLPEKIIACITQLVECNLAKVKVEGSNPSTC